MQKKKEPSLVWKSASFPDRFEHVFYVLPEDCEVSSVTYPFLNTHILLRVFFKQNKLFSISFSGKLFNSKYYAQYQNLADTFQRFIGYQWPLPQASDLVMLPYIKSFNFVMNHDKMFATLKWPFVKKDSLHAVDLRKDRLWLFEQLSFYNPTIPFSSHYHMLSQYNYLIDEISTYFTNKIHISHDEYLNLYLELASTSIFYYFDFAEALQFILNEKPFEGRVFFSSLAHLYPISPRRYGRFLSPDMLVPISFNGSLSLPTSQLQLFDVTLLFLRNYSEELYQLWCCMLKNYFPIDFFLSQTPDLHAFSFWRDIYEAFTA